jgi:hypothetical protein
MFIFAKLDCHDVTLLDPSENPMVIPRAPKRHGRQFGSVFQCRFHEYKS